jgi:hypothetical protein
MRDTGHAAEGPPGRHSSIAVPIPSDVRDRFVKVHALFRPAGEDFVVATGIRSSEEVSLVPACRNDPRTHLVRSGKRFGHLANHQYIPRRPLLLIPSCSRLMDVRRSLLHLQVKETAPRRNCHRVRAISGAEFAHDALKMDLDGLLGNE